MQRTSALAFALVVVGAGCGDDSASTSIALGTGGPGRFDDVGDGTVLQMAQGCQGLQHVWISVRVQGLDPSRAVIEARLTRASDAAMVSLALQVSLPLMPVEGGAEITGLQLVVPEAEAALDQDLLLSVRVTDRAGASVEVSKNVRVEWGDERCEDPPPNMNADAGADAADASAGEDV